MTAEKISINVVTHKSVDLQLPEIYRILAVGNNDLPYERDNTGDNISGRNKFFSELTGLYWIFKNDPSDILGLMHYRRFLSTDLVKIDSDHLLTESEIKKSLIHSQMILPEPVMMSEGVSVNWARHHDLGSWLIIRDVLNDICPSYLSSFISISKGSSCSLFNIMVCRRSILHAYCEWLFPILFELERRVDLSKLDGYQSRLIGFAAERLINVWVLHNNIVVSYCPVTSFENAFTNTIDNNYNLRSVLRRGYYWIVNNRLRKRLRRLGLA